MWCWKRRRRGALRRRRAPGSSCCSRGDGGPRGRWRTATGQPTCADHLRRPSGGAARTARGHRLHAQIGRRPVRAPPGGGLPQGGRRSGRSAGGARSAAAARRRVAERRIVRSRSCFPASATTTPGMGRGSTRASRPSARRWIAAAELLAAAPGLRSARRALSRRTGRARRRRRVRARSQGASPDASDGRGLGAGPHRLAQPALFVIEYALAQLWMEWGIKPIGAPRLQPGRIHRRLPGRRAARSKTPCGSSPCGRG